MLRPELLVRRIRALSLAALLPGTVLVAVAAGLTCPLGLRSLEPAASADADMTGGAMPGMPCLQCAAPLAQETSSPGGGKGKAVPMVRWRVGAVPLLAQVVWFDAGGRRARMPACIAFCRWLD